MKISPDPVNPTVEPPMFPGGALALQLEALLDPAEGTILFVVTGRDVGAGKLIALWSCAPQPIESYARAQREAESEFSRLVHEHTGPFPPQ